MRRRRFKTHTPNLAFDSGPTWSVYKIFADGSEQLMMSDLTFTQARHMGDHFLVGCLEGETVSLRDRLVYGW